MACATPLVTLTILTALAAAGNDPPATAAPTCPPAGRATVLLEAPEALFACADAKPFESRIWAVHARESVGDHALAARLLDELTETAPEPLRDVLAVARAKALLEAGKAAEARKALPSKVEQDWLQARSVSLGARAALMAGDFAGADQLAAQALALDAQDESALVAIRFEAALARDQKASAEKWLRTLRIRHPEARQTPAAEKAAATKLPATAFVLTAGDYGSRWRRWRWRGGAKAVAAECLEVAPTLKGARANPARYECGEALSTLRHPGAEAMLQQAARSPSVKAKSLMAIARVRGRQDKAAPVEAICQQLGKVKKGTNELVECEYLAAFLRLAAGDRKKGREALDKVATTHAKHRRAADALWLLALDDLRHDSKKALTRFDALAKTATTAESAARALYWRGRVRHAEQPEQAQADWEAAIERDPFGYYALLSASRLGKKTAPGACSGHHEAAAEMPENARLASLLLKSGFRDEAALELSARVNRRSRDALDWSAFLASAGQFRLLLDVGLAHAGRAGFPVPAGARKALEASYPLAFPRALDQVPASVDRCFVLSLMRRESRYDPDAVSAAQAHGLLQLLPSTAAHLASELKIPRPRPAELFEPELNVKLAGRYVDRLMERFGHPLLAAAAYNAGPGAVAGWVKANKGLEIDEFVERIPYRETRHYVKAVAASWNAYGLVWAGARPALPLVKVGADAGGVDY